MARSILDASEGLLGAASIFDDLFEGTILDGTLVDNVLNGTLVDETLRGTEGNDVLRGYGGEDNIIGRDGSDALYGGGGDDRLFGGTGIDLAVGGGGGDLLFGDSGVRTVRGSDRASDELDGGTGDDTLVQGDGNDIMTGGAGADTFQFRWTNPTVATATGAARAVAEIRDFDAAEDRLTFDAVGVRSDMAGVNFVDGGAGPGGAGGRAASFFSGEAEDTDGEAVMILTDQGYGSAAAAVGAATDEARGDLILYFDARADAATLLVVDGPDAAHAIARFTNLDTLGDLRAAGFGASDFVFV